MIPVPTHPRITTAYGIPGRHWAVRRHTGVDYGSPGINGASVVATAAGRVTGDNWGSAYGNHVVIQTGSVKHLYAHLSSVTVKAGQHVNAGDRVGRVGSTGNVTGPHLHYEERRPPWTYGSDQRPALNVPSKDWFDMATEQDLRRIVESVIDSRIDDIAARVNRTLGDFDGKGRPAGPNKDKPQLAANYIRQIRRLVDKS